MTEMIEGRNAVLEAFRSGKCVDKSRGSTEEYGDDDFDNCHGAKLKTKTQKLKVYREYFRG